MKYWKIVEISSRKQCSGNCRISHYFNFPGKRKLKLPLNGDVGPGSLILTRFQHSEIWIKIGNNGTYFLIMNQSSFNLFYFSCEHFVPPTWFLCTTRYDRPDNIVWRRKLKIFFSLMHLLLIVNSSSNFAIYCLMGNKFRTVFFSKLKRYKRHKSKILFFDSYIERKY